MKVCASLTLSDPGKVAPNGLTTIWDTSIFAESVAALLVSKADGEMAVLGLFSLQSPPLGSAAPASPPTPTLCPSLYNLQMDQLSCLYRSVFSKDYARGGARVVSQLFLWEIQQLMNNNARINCFTSHNCKPTYATPYIHTYVYRKNIYLYTHICI